MGCLTPKMPFPLSRNAGFFICPRPQASLGLFQIKKPCCIRSKGFFLVDKRFEISNLDLIRDMDSIIKLEEVLSISVEDKCSGFVEKY